MSTPGDFQRASSTYPRRVRAAFYDPQRATRPWSKSNSRASTGTSAIQLAPSDYVFVLAVSAATIEGHSNTAAPICVQPDPLQIGGPYRLATSAAPVISPDALRGKLLDQHRCAKPQDEYRLDLR